MSEIDDAVARYAALSEAKEQIEDEQRTIKRMLAERLGIGANVKAAGLTITVSAPARRFNIDTAKGFLTPEQIELATVSQLDAARVKSFLPPILLDQAMDPGTGSPVVRIS